jgi:DNA-binding transcriptional LysR family regulator
MASLDPTQLRYFLAIARHTSLTRAARELGVTQPALTAALRRLEEALGTTLFIRTREGVSITSTGEELRVHALEIVAAIERAEAAVLGLEEGERGRFVVGCPESLGIYLLPSVVARVARDLPRVELVLWTGRSRDVERAVVGREVHFGIVARPLTHPDLVPVDLFRDRTGLFVRGPLKRGAADARRRLLRGPLVYVDGLPQTQELFARLDERGMVPAHRLPCGSLELVKSLAAAGIGVGVLPARVACSGGAAALVPLAGALPSIHDVIRLVYRGDSHRTRAATRVKEILVEVAKALPPAAG